MKKWLPIVLLLLMAQSCKQASDDDVSIEIDCPSAEVLKSDKFDNFPTQAYQIQGHRLVGNSLRLSLALSGCNFQRNFRLVVDEAKAKSLPPQQQARLVFDEQSCQAYFEFEICFDVSKIERPTILIFDTAAGTKRIELN